AGCLDVTVTHNHLSRVGTPNDDAITVGIFVAPPFGHAAVTENTVIAGAQDLNPGLRWCGILVGGVEVQDVQPIPGGMTTIRTAGDRAMYLTDSYAASFDLTSEDAAVHHNTVEGGGSLPGILVGVRGECQMGDNLCVYQNLQVPAVAVNAVLAAVHSNRVRAGRIAMVLNVNPRQSTVVGNITSGPIDMAGPLNPPWDVLNVIS